MTKIRDLRRQIEGYIATADGDLDEVIEFVALGELVADCARRVGRKALASGYTLEAIGHELKRSKQAIHKWVQGGGLR